MPAGAREAQRPEQGADHDRVRPFVPSRGPAVRAGRLSGQLRGELLVDRRRLHAGQQTLGLGQPESQGVGPESPAFELEHLARGSGRVAVGFDHDLHGELHATALVLISPA